MVLKLSNLNSNFPLTLGYLNPASNNSALLGFEIRKSAQEIRNPVYHGNPESLPLTRNLGSNLGLMVKLGGY